MAWDEESLRAEILGEFVETNDVEQALPFAHGFHYIDRAVGRGPLTADEVARQRTLAVAKQQRYRERAPYTPATNATKETLRRRAELRRIQRMEEGKREDGRSAHAPTEAHASRWREKPPETRGGRTVHFVITTAVPGKIEGEPDRVVEIDGYLTAGEYPDGRLCEIFVKMNAPTRRVAAMLPMFDEWAKTFSIAVQYGADVDALCDKHIATRFFPDGPVRGVDGVSRCTSPVDLMCRWVKARYGKKEQP